MYSLVAGRGEKRLGLLCPRESLPGVVMPGLSVCAPGLSEGRLQEAGRQAGAMAWEPLCLAGRQVEEIDREPLYLVGR